MASFMQALAMRVWPATPTPPAPPDLEANERASATPASSESWTSPAEPTSAPPAPGAPLPRPLIPPSVTLVPLESSLQVWEPRTATARGVHPSAARCPELTELSGAELRQVLQLVGFDFDGHDRGKPKLKWPWANQAKAVGSGAGGTSLHQSPSADVVALASSSNWGGPRHDLQSLLAGASVIARNDFPYDGGGRPRIEREYWLRDAGLAGLDGLVILHVRYAGVWEWADDQAAFDEKRSIITQIKARYTGGKKRKEVQAMQVLGSPEAPSAWRWRDPARRHLTEYTPALQDLLLKGEKCSKVVNKRFVDWVAAHNQAEEAAQAQAAAARTAVWTAPDWAGLALAAPAPAPRPITILFVGVNDNEGPDLNLMEEREKVQAALDAAYGTYGWASAHKPVLKHVAYSTWDKVLEAIRRWSPTVLHLGCHSSKTGIRLGFGDTVQPEGMLRAIKAWNEEARCAQLRVIVVNACESDVHAEKLAGCVDFAIGHAAPVKDEHALTFSKTLYQCVCQGMSLAGSFDLARSAAASPGYRIYAKEKDPSKFHPCPLNKGMLSTWQTAIAVTLGILVLIIILGGTLVPRQKVSSTAVSANFATSTVRAHDTHCTSGYCVWDRGEVAGGRHDKTESETAGHHDMKVEISSTTNSDPVHELREVGVRHLVPGQVATRDAHMTQLRDWAVSDGAHRIALVGQGGSGKSTLAHWLLNEVGQGLRPSTRLVFLLQAGDLMRGYRELLAELQRLLGRKEEHPDKDEDVRRLVHVLLRDGRVRGTWMGVLDDLPSPANLADHGMGWLLKEDARGFPWGSGKTVVTSRSTEWASDHTLCSGIAVRNFEPAEAVAFLTGRVTHWRADQEGVAAVARRLSYFPLALASAAGCAKKFALGPRQYLDELGKHTSLYLQKWQSRKRAPGEYMFEYADVVRLTWERLASGEDAEAVRELLRKMAFLDPDNIPVAIFKDCQLLLPVLEEHSLVHVHRGPLILVSIHALTQQVIREHLMDGARAEALRAVLAALQAQMDTFDRDKPESYQACTCRAYTAHVKAALEQVGDADASEDAARLAVDAGYFHSTVTSTYSEARHLYERALAMRLRLGGGTESLGVARCYHSIGSTDEQEGKYEKALEMFTKSLDIKTRLYGGDNHPDVANSYLGIGNVYCSQGQYERALEYYQKCLDIRIRVFGSDHPDVANSYLGIGNVYDRQGQYERALEYYQKSLDIRIRVFGSDHPDVATSFNNIGAVYEGKGDFENALIQFQKGLEIRTRVFGSDHPDVATSFNNIGLVYAGKGEFENALVQHQKALEIRTRVFGSDHLDVAASYNNIGNIYDTQGKYEEALDYYQKSLDIKTRVVGDNHPDVAASYSNIGAVYYSQGQYERALEYYQKALEIDIKVSGQEHPDVASSFNNIGNVYLAKGDLENALVQHQKVLEIRTRVFGSEHPDVAASIKNIGIVYHNKGDRAAATEMYTKAYHIFLKVLGPHHPETQGLKPFVPSVPAIVAGGVPETGKRDGH